MVKRGTRSILQCAMTDQVKFCPSGSWMNNIVGVVQLDDHYECSGSEQPPGFITDIPPNQHNLPSFLGSV